MTSRVRPQTLIATATAALLVAIPAFAGGAHATAATAPSARSLGQQRATAYQALLGIPDHTAASRPDHAVDRPSFQGVGGLGVK
jgi:hypothetical protein